MGKGRVVVLGVNGHIGRAVAEAFVAGGWDVTGMARSEKAPIAGVRFVKGDSDSVADMRAAIDDADIVFSGLNLPYHKWFNGRLEAQLGRVLEAMGTSGKTLLFPASIYNFAATDRVLTPDLPQHPEKPRGEVRMRIEQMIEAAAARGDIQAIIVRAGDFYGPGATGDWFDQVMMTGARKGRAQTVGTTGVAHAWAYLPDLAKTFASLAAVRADLGAFERFHFAGHFVTPEDMGAAIAKVAPIPVKVSRFSWMLLRVVGLVDPLMREIGKMHYLWRNPMQLRDEQLDAVLGPDFGTPFQEAVAATVAPFFQPAPGQAVPTSSKPLSATV